VSISCKTCPDPPPESLPLVWPILPPPPAISLDETEQYVTVPLNYWLEIVGYILAVDDIRHVLADEGRIVE
jgi:hypothetical protein